MEYEIGFGNYAGIFALPSEAADKYINEAKQNELKVLIYIFRHSGKPLSEADACEFLGLAPEALKKSLDFWTERKIITYKAQNIDGSAEQEKTRSQIAARKILDVSVQYGQEEIARKSQINPEVKFLLEAAAQQLGRLISPNECSTLIYIYEGAGLPADVIIMLIGYCVSSGKGNMRYIEKMAVGWAEEGIDTHERAEHKICELEAKQSFEGQVRTLMGINDRALSPTERQHIARWSEWKLTLELVKVAYDIGVARTGKLSFSYINSILTSWHEKGITTPEQARNENKQGKGTGTGGKSPSYDIDEYVRLSLKRLNKE
jgi:DnaD/phage-associated family protein